MEATQEIRDLVNSIIDGNTVDSEAAFNDIMAGKISDRIDTYRQEVANSYFNPVAETEEETEEETTEDVTDETE